MELFRLIRPGSLLMLSPSALGREVVLQNIFYNFSTSFVH